VYRYTMSTREQPGTLCPRRALPAPPTPPPMVPLATKISCALMVRPVRIALERSEPALKEAAAPLVLRKTSSMEGSALTFTVTQGRAFTPCWLNLSIFEVL
jgi:hypothetical protein